MFKAHTTKSQLVNILQRIVQSIFWKWKKYWRQNCFHELTDWTMELVKQQKCLWLLWVVRLKCFKKTVFVGGKPWDGPFSSGGCWQDALLQQRKGSSSKWIGRWNLIFTDAFYFIWLTKTTTKKKSLPKSKGWSYQQSYGSVGWNTIAGHIFRIFNCTKFWKPGIPFHSYVLLCIGPSSNIRFVFDRTWRKFRRYKHFHKGRRPRAFFELCSSDQLFMFVLPLEHVCV